jgi:hypothetical protein
MEFEWWEAKRLAVLDARRLDFLDGRRMFDGFGAFLGVAAECRKLSFDAQSRAVFPSHEISIVIRLLALRNSLIGKQNSIDSPSKELRL